MKHFDFKLFCVLALLGTLSLDCAKDANKSSQIKVSGHTISSGSKSIDVLKSIGIGFIAAPFLGPLLVYFVALLLTWLDSTMTGKSIRPYFLIYYRLLPIYGFAALALAGHKMFVVDAPYPKVSFITELVAIMFSVYLVDVSYDVL